MIVGFADGGAVDAFADNIPFGSHESSGLWVAGRLFSPEIRSTQYYKHGRHLESPASFLPHARPMRYPALPAGAFIAAFLILIPASWLWRAGHIPTLSLIAWLFTLNIVYGANSLVWSDDAIDRVPIGCDICEYFVLKVMDSIPNPARPIATKLIVGASIALPACTFRLCKHLAMIGGNLTIGLDRRDRRRIAMFDFGFCWGIPVIFMALRKSPVVSPSIMAEELTRLKTTWSKVTDTISSNTLAANQRHTFRSLVFSSFGSHLYFYPLEVLPTSVRISSANFRHPRLIFYKESRCTTSSRFVVPYQAFSRLPAPPCRSTSTCVSSRCQRRWCSGARF